MEVNIPRSPDFDAVNVFAMPSLAEWQDLWKLWDTITLGMIPPSMQLEKPIDLRHKCLFYLGHIPTCVSKLFDLCGPPLIA